MEVAYDRPFTECGDPDNGDEPSIDHARCCQVFDLAREAGYTVTEFRKLVRTFLATNPYPSFSPANLLNAARVKVYPYAWYLDRINDNRANADAIGAYDVGGVAVYGYKHEVGAKLPVWQLHREVEPHALRDGRDDMDPDTREALAAWKDKTRRELERDEPTARPAPIFSEWRITRDDSHDDVPNDTRADDAAFDAAHAIDDESETDR